jgi:hypothetical protein
MVAHRQALGHVPDRVTSSSQKLWKTVLKSGPVYVFLRVIPADAPHCTNLVRAGRAAPNGTLYRRAACPSCQFWKSEFETGAKEFAEGKRARQRSVVRVDAPDGRCVSVTASNEILVTSKSPSSSLADRV